MAKDDKTNVMRLLEQHEIPYKSYLYEKGEGLTGTEIAKMQGQDVDQVFKTLVTVGKSKEHYVFVIPVNQELNLKKAANAAKEKSIEMIKQKELLPLTGYIHGGCSPIGMKKFFQTFIDETAILFDTIIFSGGKVGCQVEVSLSDLRKMITFDLQDLTN